MNVKEILDTLGSGEVAIIEKGEIQTLCGEKDCTGIAAWVICAVSLVEGDLLHAVCDEHMGEAAQRFRNNVTEELLK